MLLPPILPTSRTVSTGLTGLNPVARVWEVGKRRLLPPVGRAIGVSSHGPVGGNRIGCGAKYHRLQEQVAGRRRAEVAAEYRPAGDELDRLGPGRVPGIYLDRHGRPAVDEVDSPDAPHVAAVAE